MFDTTECPECGKPAEMQHRAVLASTDGPVEHVRTLCVGGHRFFLPTEALARPAALRQRQTAFDARPPRSRR
jgi:hypothetical protein